MRSHFLCWVVWIALVSITVRAHAQYVHDSAGIHVVHYQATAHPPATWHVAPVPLVAIGGGAGSTDVQFLDITAVTRLHDGTIVVANRSTNELFYFNSRGEPIAKAGRTGDGPGEFRDLTSLFVVGDTVVGAGASGVPAKFSTRGKLFGSAPRPTNAGRLPQLRGYLAGGNPVYAVTLPFNQLTQRGVVTVYGSFFAVTPAGKTVGLLNHVPMVTFVGTSAGARPEAFGARLLATANRFGLCTAYSNQYIISCLGPTGRPILEIEWARPRNIVSAEMKRSFISDARAALAHPQGGEIRHFAAPIFAEFSPQIGLLRRTDSGELWVLDYSMDTALMAAGLLLAPDDPTHWTVFSPNGSMLAAIALPRRFVPLEFGSDYVLGVARNADDVEVVTQLQLVRR